MLILGNSVFEGVGTALLIPPVYILATLWFSDLTSRAWAFGAISGLGGIGAAAGPLIGGVITTGISWRAAFVFQALVVATIILLSRRLVDPLPADPTRPFDAVGAILSAVGMFFVVFGILQAGTNNALFVALPRARSRVPDRVLLLHPRRERAGKEPLLSTRLFRNRTCNLALVTQNMQWLLLMGVSFVVSVFLQEVRGYSAIGTGVVFTAATVGVLVSSFAAQRLAKKYAQRTLIVAGFLVTLGGIGLLLGFVHASSRVVAFVPGLLLIGLGLGAMLTPSVNVVQSSFPEDTAGRDLGPLTQRLQPRLDVRHRDRRHDPRLGRRARNALLRGRDDRPRRRSGSSVSSRPYAFRRRSSARSRSGEGQPAVDDDDLARRKRRASE